MGVVANQLVEKVGIEWTFRILGFMLWAVCLPAACCIKQPTTSKSSVPQLQWYVIDHPPSPLTGLSANMQKVPLARTQVHCAYSWRRNRLLPPVRPTILHPHLRPKRQQLCFYSHHWPYDLESCVDIWTCFCRILCRLFPRSDEQSHHLSCPVWRECVSHLAVRDQHGSFGLFCRR